MPPVPRAETRVNPPPLAAGSAAPPVLVFGAGVTLLGVLRSLARAGITARVASKVDDFAARSRWFEPAPVTLPETADPVALARFLRDFPLPHGVLMPCSDAWCSAVAGLDLETLERFPASVSSPEVQRIFLDKGELRRILADLDLPHPRTREISCVADLERIPDQEFAGTFLKPRNSHAFSARFGCKAFPCRTKADAVRLYREAASWELAMLLQDYVPGPPTCHVFVDGFVDRDGRIVSLFARRRLRMHPPDFGNSSCLVSIPLEAARDAVETVTRLLTAVGLRGIFSAEFKDDPRDGRHKLLEVNARPWWYVDFASRCGVDVCRMAYDDALGRAVEETPPYLLDRRCVFTQLDWVRCVDLHRRGQLSVLRWVLEWIASSHPIFTWNDPVPAMGNLLHLLPRVLGAGGRETAPTVPAVEETDRHVTHSTSRRAR